MMNFRQTAASAMFLAMSVASTQAALLDPHFYDAPLVWQTAPHGTVQGLVLVRDVNTLDGNANAVLPAFLNKAKYSSPIRAWRISYNTTSPSANLVATTPGAPILASGIIIAPVGKPWTGAGTRPIIVFAPKTQGLGSNCAPSKALELDKEELQEVRRMVAALERGYMVAVTDYDGYMNNTNAHQYLVGQTLGHAVLDMGLALKQAIPTIDAYDPQKEVNVSTASPMAIWGYSEGGTAAAWAGQLLTSYAPSLLSSIKGIATGGMVADMRTVARIMDGSPASGMLLSGVWGYHVAYPAPFTSTAGLYFAMNDTFKKDLLGDNFASKYTLSPPSTNTPNALLHPDECVDQLPLDHGLKSVSYRNVGGYRITQFTTSEPSLHWDVTMKANEVGGYKIPVPVYFYHGTTGVTTTEAGGWGAAKAGDAMLPVENFNDVYTRMCAAKTKVYRKIFTSTFGLIPLNHETTSDTDRFPPILDWIDLVIAGNPVPNRTVADTPCN
jgi:hypothetical protein